MTVTAVLTEQRYFDGRPKKAKGERPTPADTDAPTSKGGK